MQFDEHLRLFLDGAADEAEARDLALAAVSRNVRQLKLAIAERLWLARQLSTQGDATASSEHLNGARVLKERCDLAVAEYDRLAGTVAHPRSAGHGDPALRLVPDEAAPAGSGGSGEAS